MLCLGSVPLCAPQRMGTLTRATYQIGIDMLELWKCMCLSVETSHI